MSSQPFSDLWFQIFLLCFSNLQICTDTKAVFLDSFRFYFHSIYKHILWNILWPNCLIFNLLIEWFSQKLFIVFDPWNLLPTTFDKLITGSGKAKSTRLSLNEIRNYYLLHLLEIALTLLEERDYCKFNQTKLTTYCR